MKLKSLLITAAALTLAVGVQAQGLIGFGNAAASAIYNPDGVTKPTSTTPIWIGLFLTTATAEPVDSSLEANLDSWIFSSTVSGGAVKIGPIAGIFSGGTRTIDGLASGTSVRAQVRIWSSAVGTTTFTGDYAGYRAATAGQVADAVWGYMNVPNVMTLGGGSLPTPTLTITGGIQTETLGIVPLIPEPSILALGLLGGLGTLVLIRRRK